MIWANHIYGIRRPPQDREPYKVRYLEEAMMATAAAGFMPMQEVIQSVDPASIRYFSERQTALQTARQQRYRAEFERAARRRVDRALFGSLETPNDAWRQP